MMDFGTDITAIPDLSFEPKSDFDNLAEALVRRLMTPPGGLFYDDSYGFDLREFVNMRFSDDLGFEIAAGASAEVEKDPRVLSATGEVVAMGLREYTLQIQGQTMDETPFDLILKVDAVTVEVLHDDVT